MRVQTRLPVKLGLVLAHDQGIEFDDTMLSRMVRVTESHAINAFRAIRTQVRFDEFDAIVGSVDQILDELCLYFWGPVGSVEFRTTVLH